LGAKIDCAVETGMRSLEGSLERDLKFKIGAPPLFMTDHTYERPTTVVEPSHENEDKYALDEMEISAVRATVLRDWPRMVTIGCRLSTTLKRQLPVPHWPRKLHRVTVKL